MDSRHRSWQRLVRHWTELPVAIWNGLDTSSEPPRQPLGSAIRRALEILILHLGMVTLPFTRLCTQVPSTKKNKPALRTSLSLLFFFLPSFWLFTSFPWHLFLLRTLSLDISFSWELFPFTSLSPDMISSHVFLLLFSSFDVDCIFSMSMFYSCHHSWSFPFLSIFSLTFCRPVAVCVPAKNTQALKSWEQDSKTISKYDEIWMCPKMGLPLFIIHFNKIFHFQHPFGGTPISGKPYI